MKLIILMTFQSLFLVVAQVFLKYGLRQISHPFSISFSYISHLLQNYYLGLTLLSMIISGLIWFYVIKNYELSIAYPLVSISYIFMIFAGKIFFNESVTLIKLVGIIFILAGIFFITRN